MTAVLDTSFLVAMSNSKDNHHSRVMEVARNITDPLVLPITVLPEVTYLLGTRLSHSAMRQFLSTLIILTPIILEVLALQV